MENINNIMKPKWDSYIKLLRNVLELDIDKMKSDLIFNGIALDYSSRPYHNLLHINHMLLSLKDFNLNIKEQVYIKTAIWFHDLVYDPLSVTNEIDSIKSFRQFAQTIGWFDKFDTLMVSDLIIVTTHSKAYLPKTKLEEIICDLDIKLMGLNFDLYDIQTSKIREEYSDVNDDEWKEGRTEFIETFLKRDSLFYTELYKEQFEKIARENLKRELTNFKKPKTEKGKFEIEKIKELISNFHWVCGMCDELNIYEFEEADKDMQKMKEWVDNNFKNL